jgi:RsiW-degrading membrane proteinase PrsW (M82 family)
MSRAARLVNELPLTAVLALAAAGLWLVSQGHWRRGLAVVAGAALLGGLLRLVLPTRRVGMLAVRNRVVDVVFLGGLGAAVLLLAAVVETGAD